MNSVKKRHFMMEWGKALLFAAGIALLIRLFLFEPYMVEGSSMDPTLHDGERLFVNKAVYVSGGIRHGDIVIISGQEKGLHYVKRVIGLPGDTVEVRDHKVRVNGHPSDEPYIKMNEEKAAQLGAYIMEDFPPVKVPKDEVFVMGDNRAKSMDSRNGLGSIKISRIEGKAAFIFYPFEKIRSTK
ncbi:signal peptidase I [Metabacillus indicus]|uniref:signal peptidase I n=1 Tax=Metabacillus indicus TaxID=246786 RepID=UPI002A0185C3|nr:signal peptidase I [Metabacillus indicus]MDX8291289.1 signal peptidase I [Metabacillus indicus]